MKRCNSIYVDKTEYLYNLVKENCSYYFLSRPHGFGMSRMMSTLEAIFKGRRELFKGLYIDTTDYDWKEYPVIHIDFSECGAKTPDEIERWIGERLIAIGEEYGVTISGDHSYGRILDRLLEKLSMMNKVVVLIENHDAPILYNLNNEHLDEIRYTFFCFYSILKATDRFMHLCLVTGVTNFCHNTLFGGMNNLINISMNDKYSSLLGYTQKELEENYREYIEEVRKKRGVTREEYLEEIRARCGGYCFSPEGETVYHPGAVNAFFNECGNPKVTEETIALIRETAEKVRFDISTDIGMTVSNDTLQTRDIVQMAKTEVSKRNFLSLLYQSGYLTIKRAKIVGGSYLFTLGYPNSGEEEKLKEIIT